jgi:hypothetical protein
MSTDLTGLIPFGWQGGEKITKWWRGKYITLYRLHKPCGECGAEMVLDATKAAIIGEAKNAGLHLARCPQCRAKAKDARSPGTSRPTVLSAQPDTPAPAGDEEIGRLRLQNEHFLRSVQALQVQLEAAKADLEKSRASGADLFKILQASRAEIADLKARLAKYELQPAMQVISKWPGS